MQLLKFANHLCRAAGRYIRIVRNGLGDLVTGVVGHIVLQHIQNELFFDRLPHTVNVEGVETAVAVPRTEHFQRRGLGGGGECEEREVFVLALLDEVADQLILRINFIFCLAFDLSVFLEGGFCISKSSFQLHGCGAGLAGMGFINDHSEVAPGCLFHFLIDDRELLQRGDDDSDAVIDGIFQVLGGFILADGFH